MNNQIGLMQLTKSSNKNVAVVGDILTFKLVASNIGDIALGTIENEPVSVYDVLPPELEFIEGSVKIDNVSEPTLDVNSGVDIGILNTCQSKTITFDARVVSHNPCPITNTASASYGYILPGGCQDREIINSNPFTLDTYIAQLDVIKNADKNFVVLGDVITYSIKVVNSGLVEAINVIFKDIISSGAHIIDGSFKIGSKVVNKVNLENGINIGTINPGDTVNLQYKVKVVFPNCSLQFENNAYVKFTFVLPNGCTGIGESKHSSASSNLIHLGITNFKQISIEEYLTLSAQKPDIEQINTINGTIDIIKSHVIETNKVVSVEGQHLSGYKLIVHGVLNEVIEYTACEDAQGVHSSHSSIPFSTFVILPENYQVGTKIDIDAVVEDIFYKEVDCRIFFTNATVLINVKVLSC